jgi:hypothetical protein
MAITLGPKLGLLYNANINEQYYDAFRPFLQALDALVQANVLNASTVVPPVSPNSGDAYLLISTPSGAWAGHQNAIAVWDTQVTNSGTDTRVPAWVFYAPNPGWIVWNVATAGFLGWTGSAWSSSPFGGGANFPANTDITSMTGLTVSTGTAVTVGITSNAGNGVNFNGSTGGSGGNAFTVTDGIHNSSWSLSGQVNCGGVACSGSIVGGQIQASSGLVANALGNATPGTAVSVSNAGGSVIALEIVGTGTIYNSMLGFATYPTQTTVGAAGGASALPATPTGYLPVSIAGVTYVIPYYLHV